MVVSYNPNGRQPLRIVLYDVDTLKSDVRSIKLASQDYLGKYNIWPLKCDFCFMFDVDMLLRGTMGSCVCTAEVSLILSGTAAPVPSLGLAARRASNVT